MTVHTLKTWTTYFQQMRSGKKTFEIRKNDRGFQLGDLLICWDYDPELEQYSGDKLYYRVTYLTDASDFGALSEGFVCMSLSPLEFPVFLVLQAASDQGVSLTDDQAGWVLWNETGYPSFWQTTMEQDIPRQIAEWCEKKKNDPEPLKRNR